MRVVIAGGTGFLGRALTRVLDADAHRVTILTRRVTGPSQVAWDPAKANGAWTDTVSQADAVINLAGESITGGRWTPARKQALRDSRIGATRALAGTIAAAARNIVFLSASGVGVYGTSEGDTFTEESPTGSDFLADLCKEWERTALQAVPAARVILLRTGVVLGHGGGALPELARPFRFFAGGPIGSGRQPVSWIHLDDWLQMTKWAMTNVAVSGPLNLTAPAPVTNSELAHALGRAMHRPSLLPAPAFALRLMLGEMADAAILNGQRVLPAQALRHGYTFRYRSLDEALEALFPVTPTPP
jgi:uncharacterized protein (TIGR01777 family)